MLKSLHIKNYALLDKITINFGGGLNIITGETGAGKSILIDALGIVLGDKTDPNSIRTGANKAIVEGHFEIGGADRRISALLKDNNVEENDDLLILRREVNDSGRSRAFINDTPVAAPLMIEVGNLLVDLHGQHEHQSLLNFREHVHYLDAYGQLGSLVKEVGAQYELVQNDLKRLKELRQKEALLQEKRDLYAFQLREIDVMRPEAGEDERLEREEKLLENSEKLYDLTQTLHTILYEEEGSATERLYRATQLLSDLMKIDDVFASLNEMCRSAHLAVEEVAKTVHAYRSQIEFSPQRLEEIRERLSKLSGLKKKYGGSIDSILECADSVRNELSLLENLDQEKARAEQQLLEDRKKLSALCADLSLRRNETARKLEGKIVTELSVLGMPHSRFMVKIERIADDAAPVTVDGRVYRTTPLGIDNVEFYISTNPGEELRQLAKVASGGEISRIMLALKTTLANSDHIPVLIFDEIDLGISGRIAQVVGRSLKNLARTHQVICITHLPQIASMGERHYLAVKMTRNNRTCTSINRLKEEERPREIAKLIGGEYVSETHIRGAKQLLDEAKAQG